MNSNNVRWTNQKYLPLKKKSTEKFWYTTEYWFFFISMGIYKIEVLNWLSSGSGEIQEATRIIKNRIIWMLRAREDI